MAHPVHHTKSSAKKSGGDENGYLPIHEWSSRCRCSLLLWEFFDHRFGSVPPGQAERKGRSKLSGGLTVSHWYSMG